MGESIVCETLISRVVVVEEEVDDDDDEPDICLWLVLRNVLSKRMVNESTSS